jgi:hypothetical protein
LRIQETVLGLPIKLPKIVICHREEENGMYTSTEIRSP